MARYAGVTWDPSPNLRPGPTRKVRVVAHRMAGSYAGGLSWLKNPKSQVSANFTVDNVGGEGRQLVDTADIAWAQANFNDDSISIEIGGLPGDPVSAAAWATITNIVRQAHEVDGVLLELAVEPDFDGLAYHGQLGAAGGNHPDCPGPVVIANLPAVLAAAGGSTSPGEAMGKFNLVDVDLVTGVHGDYAGRLPFYGTDHTGAVFAFNGAIPIRGLNERPELGPARTDVVGIRCIHNGLIVLFCDDGHPDSKDSDAWAASTYELSA